MDLILDILPRSSDSPVSDLLRASLGLDIWEITPDHMIVRANAAKAERVQQLGYRVEQLLRQAKLGEGGRPCKGIAMLETFYATQQVRALTGQGWPPAGIECCVVRGGPRLRSVHRERAGRVMEPRKHQAAESTSLTVRKTISPVP